MRKTSGQTRDRLGWVDTSALDETIHLHGAQGEVLNESVAGRDKLGALLNDGFTRSLVRGVDDQGKVLRSHERRT